MIDALHARLTASAFLPLTNLIFNRRHITRDYRELRQLEQETSEQIQDFQLQKVQEQLRYAAQWVPFYGRRFDEIGLDPRDIKSLDDLRHIPALTRSDLVENRADLVDRRYADAVAVADERGWASVAKPIPFARWRKRSLVRHTSSGSTGEPVVYYEDGSKSAATWAFERVFKDWFNVPPAPREVRLLRLATDFVPRGATFQLRKLLWRQVALPGMNLTERDYELTYRTLEEFRPTVIWGLTSALRALAEFLQATGKELTYRPRLVVTWAEPAYDYEEKLLGQVFDSPTTNVYSSQEVGHIACQCPAGSFHIDQRHLLVEIERDRSGFPDTNAGEVLVTTLFNSPMPFIRYRLGDAAELSDSTCSCGRNLQVLKTLLGRTFELHTTRDGRMLGPNFWLHLFRRDVAGFVQRFQVTYKRDDSIHIKVVKKKGHVPDTANELWQLIERNLGGQTAFDWEYVEDIEPEPSGKVPITKREKDSTPPRQHELKAT